MKQLLLFVTITTAIASSTLAVYSLQNLLQASRDSRLQNPVAPIALNPQPLPPGRSSPPSHT